MAIIDRERNVVVLRIAYDGPAGAGKTTTVRSLAAKLGRPCSTPEEAGGRTLFFDWLDYTSGLFEGRQIRCQVVSVPGQGMLAHRRAYLLSVADAVVYVSPVTHSNLPEVVRALRSLRAQLIRDAGTGIGIILQANKRDQPGALELHDIREALKLAALDIDVTESTATDGLGVRESFVFSVRQALETAKRQASTGNLLEGTPEIDSAEELLGRIRTLQGDGNTSQFGEQRTSSSDVHEGPGVTLSDTGPLPRPPDSEPEVGSVWPPLEGRGFLLDAVSEPARLWNFQHAWHGSTNHGWRYFSGRDEAFTSLEAGKAHLLRLARLHTGFGTKLSAPRCVVISPDGHGSFRVWQVFKERVTLRERLALHLEEASPERLVELFLDTARRLTELRAIASDSGEWPCPVTLDSSGVYGGETQYVGTLSFDAAPPIGYFDTVGEFAPLLRDWAHRRVELGHAFDEAIFRSALPDQRLLSELRELL